MKLQKDKRLHKLKILLIEDEAKIAEFVIQGLRLAGHEVSHVQDGEQGLAQLSRV